MQQMPLQIATRRLHSSRSTPVSFRLRCTVAVKCSNQIRI